MHLDSESIKGAWTEPDSLGRKFFIINDAIISNLCILGDDFEPCFEGANITSFSLDDEFNNKIYNLMKEVQKLKGGNLTVEENIKKPEEETVDLVKDESVEKVENQNLEAEGTSTEEGAPAAEELAATEEEEAVEENDEPADSAEEPAEEEN